MDLKHPFKTSFSTIRRSDSFYWFKCLLSHPVLHNIFLQAPVHDQLKLDMFENIRNDEAYDDFNNEVCHVHMSLGTAIVIFIV